jgi:tetratricopeptide (TPR) repeat protein
MHVVVLAYGPGQQTKNAVRRARKLAGSGHQILAVAASPVGVEAVASLPGATTFSDFGNRGVRTALSSLPPEPTLLIHDDVVMTTRGVLALERELEAGSRLVVPYSNDPGMDHFAGPLPAGKAAERSLDQLPVPTESRSAIHVRAACVAGHPGDLLTLLERSPADPFSSIASAEYGFTVAARALASHATTCIGRLVEEPARERPLLVAAIIVRNEEQMLPDCLASLEGVCDRIEICDTGSTDRTVEIARRAGANVIEWEWRNDFGAARNRVLEECRDARYVLWIDADERLVCPDPLETRRYLATYAAEHPSFNLEITNLESDGNEMYRFIAVRLFHADGTEFRGALHEAVYRIGDTAPLNGHRLNHMTINHHGYAREVVAARGKAERNLEIAEAQHETEGDARSAIHLARSLSFAEESPQRAIELLEAGIADADNPVTVAQIKGLIADRYLQVSENRMAFDTAREALQILHGDDTALGVLAMASKRLGNHEEFITIAEEIGEPDSDQQVLTIDHNRHIFNDQLVSAYSQVGAAEKAVAKAFALLEENPGGLSSWPVLISCLSAQYGDATLELVLPLTVKDTVGRFLEPLIKTFPSASVADFCAAYLTAGGSVAEATRVGLLAAAMSNNDKAFARISPKASDLDPFVRVGLADRIAESGRPDLADELRAAPIVLKL